MNREESGTSLVEMIGVVGVIGVILAGAVSLVATAMQRYALSKAVAQLQSLQKGISRYYAAAGSYEDLSVQDIIKEKVPMSDMISSSSTLVHAFRGDVTLDKVADDDGIYSTFTITFKGLGARQCLEMATISWPRGASVDLVSETVGSTKYSWPAYSGNDDTLPVDIAKAQSNCTVGELTNITWEFR